MKILKDGGFNQQQAEILTTANSEAFEQLINLKELATKKDVNNLKNDIYALKIDIENVKIDLQKFILRSIIGTAALITAIQVILPFLKLKGIG